MLVDILEIQTEQEKTLLKQTRLLNRFITSYIRTSWLAARVICYQLCVVQAERGLGLISDAPAPTRPVSEIDERHGLPSGLIDTLGATAV